MITAEAAFRSLAARVTVCGNVKGVVTLNSTSSLRACFSTAKNTWIENRTAASEREISADLPGHQLLISITSGLPATSGRLEAEPGALVITMTLLLRASSWAISVM